LFGSRGGEGRHANPDNIGTFPNRAVCDVDSRQFVNAKESAPM
jgi:hypothetical protein